MTQRMRIFILASLSLSLAIVLLALAAAPSMAAISFSNDFSSNTAGPNMNVGPGVGGASFDFSGDNALSPNGRITLRTNDTDYASTDFTFEVTVTMAGTDNSDGWPFWGMGEGDTSGGAPINPKLLGQLLSTAGGTVERYLGYDDNFPTVPEQDFPLDENGTHRLRMEWDSTTELGTFSADMDWPGTGFTPDFSFVKDGSDNGFDLRNSRLYVLGGGGVSFDDIQVNADDKVVVDGMWNRSGGGDWNVAGNWNGTLPDTNNENAIFGGAIQATSTVFVDSSVTVNSILFDNSNTYAIAGTQSINLDANTKPFPDLPNITVAAGAQGAHQFQVVVNLHTDTTVNIPNGATLRFNNELNLGGNSLTKAGSGVLSINNKLTTSGGTLSVREGTVAGVGTIGGDLNNGGGTISPGSRSSVLGNGGVPEPSTFIFTVLAFLVVFAPAWRRR